MNDKISFKFKLDDIFFVFAGLCVCLSVCLLVCMFACLCVCLSVCLLVWLFACLIITLSNGLSDLHGI
jgi:hypothetical protein